MLVWAALFRLVEAEYNPILTVNGCTRNTVSVSLTGAENGGIVYVQGQGQNCKQTTSSGISTYKFDLIRCGLEWGEAFRLVVQRSPRYQTGQDKQFPVTCQADLSDLDVSKGMTVESGDDESHQRITVKPSAGMKLLKNGRQIGGASVRLGDVITMELKLDAKYIDDFDIRAKSCTASFIDIISGYCADDPELFPDFTGVSRGTLTSTFGAFRTTNFNGGAVRMTFSCVLQVCLGNCPDTHCPRDHSGSGKRKRRTTTANSYHHNGSDVIVATIKESHILSLGSTPGPVGNQTNVNNNNSANSHIQSKNSDTAHSGRTTNNSDTAHSGRTTNNSDTAHSGRKPYTEQGGEGPVDDKVAADSDDIKVEGILDIASDGIPIKEKQRESKVCLDYGVSVSIMLFMIVGLMTMFVTAWRLTKKTMKKRSVSNYHRCEEDMY